MARRNKILFVFVDLIPLVIRSLVLFNKGKTGAPEDSTGTIGRLGIRKQINASIESNNGNFPPKLYYWGSSPHIVTGPLAQQVHQKQGHRI